MRSKDPSYVVFSKRDGGYLVQPWITHPAECVCSWCAKNRTPDNWGIEVSVRLNRKSRFPKSETKSIVYAQQIKVDEELRLRRDLEESRRSRSALGGTMSLGKVLAAYTKHLREDGKRLDRDQYRIEIIEEFFGADVAAASLAKTDVQSFVEHLKAKRKVSAATVHRYLNTLSAAFNSAVSDGLLAHNPLRGVRRPKWRRMTKPRTFSKAQIQVLFGEAMDAFEREQAAKATTSDPRRLVMRRSALPLRGICLIAFRTLMRPENNFNLRWEQLSIDRKRMTGSFHLKEHKNASKGIEVLAPLSPSLLRYLISIMPDGKPTGFVHPNPDTGRAYRNIRKGWKRLIEIANAQLGDDDQIVNLDFYHLRHTGASQIAEMGDPVLVCRMMGDVSLDTVMRHYFDSSLQHMQKIVEKWDMEEKANGALN